MREKAQIEHGHARARIGSSSEGLQPACTISPHGAPEFRGGTASCIQHAYRAGGPGIQAPQIGQQHNTKLQKSLAVPPRPGNFDTLLHAAQKGILA
jgi:hypothetical protein